MARSIQEMYEKFKSIVSDDGFFYGSLIVLVAVSSFGLGRLSLDAVAVPTEQKATITLTKKPTVELLPQTNSVSVPAFVGSKNGTKYHALGCPGASQIKEENKVFFASIEEAERAGYSPAANCKEI